MQSVRTQTNKNDDEHNARMMTINFFKVKAEHKEADDKYKKAQRDFYDYMDGFFSKHINGNKYTFATKGKIGKQTVTVNHVEPKTVVFDPKKIKNIIKKNAITAPGLITSSVTVDDIEGLKQYVKSLGGDPKVFKSFLNVEQQVDAKMLENLVEIGEIDERELDGTYTVKQHSPQYRISLKVDDDDESDE